MEEKIKLVVDTTQSQKSLVELRKELNAINNEMADLEEGSDAFNIATQKAGTLKHQLEEIQSTTKGTSADFGNMLSNITQTVNGIVGAFTVAQGALNLFGVESKAVTESIKQLQSLMAIGQGLTQITAMTKALPELQSKITGTSKAAKILKSALTPKTMLIATAAITGLTLAYNALKEALSKTNEESQRQLELNKKIQETYSKELEPIAKLQTEITLLKNVLDNENISLDEKKTILEKLNELIPDYNAHIDETTNAVIANTDAENKYIAKMKEKAKVLATQKVLEEQYVELIKTEVSLENNRILLENTPKYIKKRTDTYSGIDQAKNVEYDRLVTAISNDEKRIASLNKSINDLTEGITDISNLISNTSEKKETSSLISSSNKTVELTDVYSKIGEAGEGTIVSLIESAQKYFESLERDRKEIDKLSEKIKEFGKSDADTIEGNIKAIMRKTGLETEDAVLDYVKNSNGNANQKIRDYIKQKKEILALLDSLETIVTEHKRSSEGFSGLRSFLTPLANKEQLEQLTVHKYNIRGDEKSSYSQWQSAEEWLNAYNENKYAGLIRFKKVKDKYFKLLNEFGTQTEAITEAQKVAFLAAEKNFRAEYQTVKDTILQVAQSIKTLEDISRYKDNLEGNYDKRIEVVGKLNELEATLVSYQQSGLEETADGLAIQLQIKNTKEQINQLELERNELAYRYNLASNDIGEGELEKVKLMEFEIEREEEKLKNLEKGTVEYYKQYLAVKKLEDEKEKYEKDNKNNKILNSILNKSYTNGLGENNTATQTAYKEEELRIAEEILNTLTKDTAEYEAQLLVVNRLKASLKEISRTDLSNGINVATNALQQLGSTLANISSIQQNIIKDELEAGKITEEQAKEQFEQSKKVAIAGAVMNSISAIIGAWASWMNPTNAYMTTPIQVAMATLQTVALGTALGLQIQQIKQTELGSSGSVSSSAVNSTIIPPTDYSTAVDNAELHKKIGDNKYYVSVEEFNKVGKRYSTEVEESRF